MIRPMVAMLPAWFRFAQCIRRYRDTREAFPHLANALKYSTSFFVVIFSSLSFVTGSHLGSTNNPYFYLWIIASLISSIFAYIWDVKMDWGLFDLKSKDNKFLREETVYSSNVCAIPYSTLCHLQTFVRSHSYLSSSHFSIFITLAWLKISFFDLVGLCPCRW